LGKLSADELSADELSADKLPLCQKMSEKLSAETKGQSSDRELQRQRCKNLQRN
jgi:hypothetical protein